MNVLGLSFLDLGGSLIAVISVICMLKKSKWYWYLSIICNILWFWLFTSKSIFISAGLQVSYVFFAIYGVVRWHMEDKQKKVPSYIDCFGVIISLAIFVVTVFNTRFINFNSYIEPIAAFFLITANWLTARKIYICWYFWMIGNILYGIFLWNSNIFVMCLLQFIFFALSILGLLEWKKTVHYH
jgi:nicotinamide mononucleotide transporter